MRHSAAASHPSRRPSSVFLSLLTCALLAFYATPAAAKKGGNGNGNGNGGNKPPVELHLELHPDVWNLNWDNSSGRLQAFVRGDGAELIDLDSLSLVGDAGSALPIAVRFVGGQLVASFAKADALATLGDPLTGDVRTLTLQFTSDGDAGGLTDTIRIIGRNDDGDDDDDDDGEPEPLGLQIKPRKWNLNWSHSRGTVQVFFRGEGVADIDLSSIQLIGDDPLADPVEAIVAKLAGNHVMARFSKSAAFAALLDPVATGEERTVEVHFLLAGVPTVVELEIKILGP